MVEEIETSKVLEELSRNNDAGSDGGPAGRSGGRSGGRKARRPGRTAWLVVFFLLLPLLSGAALLGYQQWTLYLRLNSLATANNQLLEAIQTSNDRLAVLETAGGQEDSVAEIDQAAIDVLRQEFDARVEQLGLVINELRERSLSSPTEDDSHLRLVEVEHLLRIGNRHLQLTDDVATTIRLLETADQLLLDSGDSRVIQAREALARELAQLRNTEAIDIDGLYLRLTALRELLADLDIAVSIGDSYQQQLTQARQESTSGSTQEQQGSLLDSGLAFFSTIFVWREWDGTPEIVQPSRELVTIRQTIDLMLEQSQLALLTRRPAVYEQNLQAARDLIARHTTESDQAASQILTQLDRLIEESLAPELPDTSESLRQVRLLNARQSASGGPIVQ